MPTLPLHPAIVHLPLGLAMVAPLAASAAALALWRGWMPRRAFSLLVAFQALVVMGAFASARVGEREARRVEAVIGEGPVEAHEEAAEIFLMAAAALWGAAAAVLVLPTRAAHRVAAAVAAGSFVVAGLAIQAGGAGGELVYHRGAAAAFGTPARDGRAVGPAVLLEERD